MAKFCAKCGRPLKDGEICSCQAAGGNQQAGPGGQQRNRPGGQQMGTGYGPNGQQMGPGYGPGGQPMGTGYGQNGQQMGTGYGQNGQQAGPGYGPGGQPIGPGYGPGGQQVGPGGQPIGPGYYEPGGQNYGRGQASAFAQGFLARVWNLVKSPVTAGREMIQEADVKVALLMIVFQGMFSGLFGMAFGQKCSQFLEMVINLTGGDILGDYDDRIGQILEMPYAKIFLVTVLASVALACILAGLLTGVGAILKLQLSYAQMLSAVAIRSAVLVPSILLSLLVFELWMPGGIALFVLVNIWGFSAMQVALSSFVGREKLNVFVLLSSIALVLFVFIVWFAMSKLWMEYLPDLLRTGLKAIEDFSWQDLLEDGLKDIF